MARQFHLTNDNARDATVGLASCPTETLPVMGLEKKAVRFHRYLSATEACLHQRLRERFGDEYSKELVDGDPEVDMEKVGRHIGRVHTVYLAHDGDVLHASPKMLELIVDPDGSERERREPQDIEANVNDEMPVRWTGRKLKKADVVRKFVFKRTLQIKHVDGLSYDFLYAMAKDLHAEGALVLLGGGAKGKDPLIFNANGTPFRGFLEGRIDNERYQLLLHLSNMELKNPELKKEQGA